MVSSCDLGKKFCGYVPKITYKATINGIVVSAAAGDSQRCGRAANCSLSHYYQLRYLAALIKKVKDGCPTAVIFQGTMVFPVSLKKSASGKKYLGPNFSELASCTRFLVKGRHDQM